MTIELIDPNFVDIAAAAVGLLSSVLGAVGGLFTGKPKTPTPEKIKTPSIDEARADVDAREAGRKNQGRKALQLASASEAPQTTGGRSVSGY